MNAPGRYESVRMNPGQAKVTVVSDPQIPNSKIFYFAKEDHTLGNALRMSLLRDPAVRFAGYRIPHPLEYVCELKVQTAEISESPLGAVIRSLDLVSEEFESLEAQFSRAFAGTRTRE